ncbi:RIP metalloprotease RseP [candidate division WOR-3 bacterium]|nr:RIP metalloprotease RseP [candidate division WOR-3 bacterium]
MNFLSTIVLLGILISFHEFGHFIFARAFGVSVPKFSVGFGPKIFGFSAKGTYFQLSAIPLGGFVKMKGEADADDGKREFEKDDFRSKNFFQKTAIVTAGPLFNVILAWSFMFLADLLMSGYYIPVTSAGRIDRNSSSWEAGLRSGDSVLFVGEQKVSEWGDIEIALNEVSGEEVEIVVSRSISGVKETKTYRVAPDSSDPFLRGLTPMIKPVVGEVSSGPAESAGMAAGDTILFIAPSGVLQEEELVVLEEKGFPKALLDTVSIVFTATESERSVSGYEVEFWQDVSVLINSVKSDEFVFAASRSGEILIFNIKPIEIDGRKLIGISINLPSRRTGVFQAAKMSLDQIRMTFVILAKIPEMIASKKITLRETFGGPVRVFHETSKAAKMGFDTFLFLAGFISLNLAIFNLLPFLPLDGGHVMIHLVESLTRKKIPAKTIKIMQAAGFSLLLFFAILVTANDILNLFA